MMKTRLRRVPTMTLEEKMAWWISRSINVLFRCGPSISVAAGVTAAFAKAGLQRRVLSSYGDEFKQALGDVVVEAVFIDGLDRLPKKYRRAVVDVVRERPSRKIVWATVPVLDEDDFDLETGAVQVDGFDVVVDVPIQPTSPR